MDKRIKLSIGEFSKLCGVTVKTLRHYEKTGLLKPEEVDQWSGYRYYTVSQMQVMMRIRALKDLGLSLDEIYELSWETGDGNCTMFFEPDPEMLRGKLLLFHGNESVAEDVLLLGKLGLGIQDLQVEIVIAQAQYLVTGPYVRPFLNDDFLHYPAFLRTDLHGGHRLHLSADTNIVIELTTGHFIDCQGVAVHPESRGTVPEDEPENEDGQQSKSPIWQ